MNNQFRSLLIFTVLLFASGMTSCAQESSKRMVPGPSFKDLVPESPNQGQDGITQIIFAQLFKPGTTEYKQVGASALKGAPPLPTGYVLLKDLVYQVKTESIVSGLNITVFNVWSAKDEKDFRNLAIIHLENDEMSPSGQSWNVVTLFPESADERIFSFIPKAKYDSLQPDFKSRRIAAVTNEFGIFAIALVPDSLSESSGPFTNIEVVPSSSPEPVKVGDEVTHNIVVENKGPKAAAEVNVKEGLDPDLVYKSAASNQGTCKQSTESSGRILCHLGTLPTGATATITVVARVSDNPLMEEGSKLRNDLEVNFKENPTDFVDADTQVFSSFSTRIVRKP